MKKLILFFLITPIFLIAGPAPLMDFSPYLPAELSQENEKALEGRSSSNMEEFNRRQIPWWPLMATLIFFIAFGIIRQFKQKLTPEEQLKVREEKAKSLAIAALQQLQSANLPKKGQMKSYFVQLSSIVRHYIKNRYRIPTPVETTPEFIENMKTFSKLSKHTVEELALILEQSDHVKFARHTPTIEECQKALLMAYNVIKKSP